MPLLQTLVTDAGAWTTPSGTCTALTGQDTAMHKGKNYNVWLARLLFCYNSVLWENGWWTIVKRPATSASATAAAIRYKVVLSSSFFSVPLLNLPHAYALAGVTC